MALELEGLSIKTVLDAKGMTEGAKDGVRAVEDLSTATASASSKMQRDTKEMGDSFDGLSEDMDGATASSRGLSDSMDDVEQSSQTLASATDHVKSATESARGSQEGYNQALDEYGNDAPRTKEALQGYQTEAGKAATETDKVTASQEKLNAKAPQTDQSMRTTAMGMVQVATSAMALYGAYDAVGNAQLAMDRANLQVEKSQKEVTSALKAYNDAVVKYGKDSMEATFAAENLRLKQEEVKLNTDAATNAQDQYNQKMVQLGITAIPAVISGIDGLSKAWKGLKNLDLSASIGKITEVLIAHKGAIISAGAGLAAIAIIYEAFNTTSEDTRVAMSLLAGGLVAAAAAQWIWNTATAFGIGLTGVGLALVATAAAAAAIVYAASSTYGAKIPRSSGADAGQYSPDESKRTITKTEAGTYTSGGQAYSDEQINDIRARKNSGQNVSSDELAFLDWWDNRFAGNSYDSGGISTTPQTAIVSGGGEPELHLTKDNISSFGLGAKTIIFYINGAKDVDIVADAVAARLHAEGM